MFVSMGEKRVLHRCGFQPAMLACRGVYLSPGLCFAYLIYPVGPKATWGGKRFFSSSRSTIQGLTEKDLEAETEAKTTEEMKTLTSP